jgi:hypothetical protein
MVTNESRKSPSRKSLKNKPLSPVKPLLGIPPDPCRTV